MAFEFREDLPQSDFDQRMEEAAVELSVGPKEMDYIRELMLEATSRGEQSDALSLRVLSRVPLDAPDSILEEQQELSRAKMEEVFRRRGLLKD